MISAFFKSEFPAHRYRNWVCYGCDEDLGDGMILVNKNLNENATYHLACAGHGVRLRNLPEFCDLYASEYQRALQCRAAASGRTESADG